MRGWKRFSLLMLCLLITAALAVTAVGCGKSALETYKEEADSIHSRTGEVLTDIFNELSQADFENDPMGAMAELENAMKEGYDALDEGFNDLLALEVPPEAEDVQEKLIDLYLRGMDLFSELETTAATLDLTDPAAVEDFVDKMQELQDIGQEGEDLGEEIQNL